MTAYYMSTLNIKPFFYIPPQVSDTNVYSKHLHDDSINYYSDLDVMANIDSSKDYATQANLISNPSFDTSTLPWIVVGNHSATRITSDYNTAPACMQVTATGAGSRTSNAARITAAYEFGKVYYIEFYAKSISGNTTITITDSAAGYISEVEITTEWKLHKIAVLKRVYSGSSFQHYLNGAGVYLIDDIFYGELDGKHLTNTNTPGTSTQPDREPEYIEYIGDQFNSATGYNPTNQTIYAIVETLRNGTFSGFKVMNRLNDIGVISNGELRIAKNLNNPYIYTLRLKELLIRDFVDSVDVKDQINKYYKTIYDLPDLALSEKTNRDILLNKITPYIEDSEQFIFAAVSDFHMSNTLLPTILDLIKYSDALYNKIKFASAHGDLRNRVDDTDTLFIDNIQYNLHPQIADYSGKLLVGIGNHDFGTDYGQTESLVGFELDNKQMFDNYIAPSISISDNVTTDVLNVDSMYYYKDFAADKMRIIYVNQYDTIDTNDGTVFDYIRDSRVYSEEQLTFITDIALNVPSSDWHVTLVMHDPSGFDSSDPLMQILQAYKNNTSFNIAVNSFGRNYSLNRDFSTINNFNGTLVAVFAGHAHIPSITLISGVYIIVTIGADSINGLVDWPRTYGTLDQMASDFVMINKTERRIRMLRYGSQRSNNGDPNDNGDRGFADNTYDQIITY